MLSNGASTHVRNGSNPNNGPSHETSFRQMSSGSLNIPAMAPPPNGTSHGQLQNTGSRSGAPTFAGPRSPPNKQNTNHVPCKFFRQGACQAGKACPFSHDLAATVDNVCKYFAKGNCKFGPKCANIHVLPNGQRVNYKGGAISAGPNQLNIGGRVNLDPYHGHSSALTNALYRAPVPSGFGGQYAPFTGGEELFPPLRSRTSIDALPVIDTSLAPHTGSAFGSPRDEDAARFGLGLSPGNVKGLSVLDAPLPASFDSNGISQYARYGPIAASVPKRFGLDSPAHSLSHVKDSRTTEALKSLHNSAFGDDTRDRFNGVPASPPAGTAEEYFGKRPMHSQRSSKPKLISASVPRVPSDWEDFTFEEDFIPDSLQDLLTPQEKARRMSRNDEETRFSAHNSGTGTPEATSKYGSPSNASPSRWSLSFRGQQKDDEEKPSRASAFGHVGSPLRNSSLLGENTSASKVIARNAATETSPWVSSPPRQSSASIISQQLSRTRLCRAESAGSDGGSLGASRVTSNPIGTGRRADFDRTISSSSVGTNRFTTPIDESNEEQADFVFRMEEEEDTEKRKRDSGGGWSYPTGGRSPHLGAQNSRKQNGNGAPPSGLSGGGIAGLFGSAK